VVTRDRATYTIPGPKFVEPASTVAVCRPSPCDLCIVIAKAIINGNWRRVYFSTLNEAESLSMFMMACIFSNFTAIVLTTIVFSYVVMLHILVGQSPYGY